MFCSFRFVLQEVLSVKHFFSIMKLKVCVLTLMKYNSKYYEKFWDFFFLSYIGLRN